MKRNTWKKTIAFVVAMTLVAGYSPLANVWSPLTQGTEIVAKAEGVTFLDWDTASNQLKEATLDEGVPVIVQNSSTAVTWGETGQETWYVVNSTVQIDELITVQGTVNLILADGAQLTAQKGITFVFGTLNIYAQSTGDAMGKLIANGDDYLGYPAIYGNNLTINGGNVTANGFSSDYSAGLGIQVDDLKINGGIVTATGGNGKYAATGILCSTYFTMNGGTVTAKGGDGTEHPETGIRSTYFTMNGGTVTATGGNGPDGGYGIRYSLDGSATFNGGTVIATGGAEGIVGIYEGNLVLGTDVKLYGSDTETPPTTELTDTTTRYRYMKAAGAEQQGGGDPSSSTTIGNGDHCVVKAGDMFKVDGDVNSIKNGDVTLFSASTIPANTVFTASLADSGNLTISGGVLSSLGLGGWSGNSAKTYFVMYYNGTLTFIENKVHNSKLNDVYIELTLGDVLAPGASFRSTGTYYFQKSDGGYNEYGQNTEFSVGAGGLIQGVPEINFADNKNAFVFDHIDSGKYYFNQTHIDLGATVATPPTANNRTYDGTEKPLLATAGTASDGAEMWYSAPGEVVSNNGELVELTESDIKVGNIYAPTQSMSAGFFFPAGYALKYNNTEYKQAQSSVNGMLLFYHEGYGYKIGDGFTTETTLADNANALMVTAINTNTKTIEVNGVNTETGAGLAWGGIPNGKDAGTYTVFYKAVRASDSTESVIGSVDVMIEKANPTVTTAPTAISGLKYNGGEQTLINAGSAANGTLEYGLAEPIEVIKKGGYYELSGADLTVGKIFKPSDSSGFNFPTGKNVKLLNNNDVIYPCNDADVKGEPEYDHVNVYLYGTTPLIYIDDLTDKQFPDDCDALRIDKINGDTIEVTAVKSSECFEVKTWSATPPKGTNAGEYNVCYRVKGNDNYNDIPATKIENVKIEKGTATATAPTAKTDLKYTGSAQYLITAGSATNGTIKYAVTANTVNTAPADNSTDWVPTIPQKTDADTYKVWYKAFATDTANYNDSTAASVEVEIKKASALKTAPTAKTGLTNRTTPVQLINAGVPQENCKIEYALGTQTQSDGVWKESASDITATEKGTFYVWYKVASSNPNYADFTAIEPIEVTVSQYVAPTTSKSSQTWTLTMDSYAYDGTAHEPTINGTTRGTVTYTYYNADTDEELDEAPSAIGNYKVKVYASGNNAYNSKSLIKTYSITDPIDKNGMASVDAFKANGTVPASDGKIFAGWFTDSTCTKAYTEDTGKAYAKFIDENVLTVKAQISSGTTASSEKTSIRFITSVDSLKYQNVGFKITCNGKTIDRKMTKVYTAINAGGAKVKPTVFSEDSRYMEAYTLNNVRNTYGHYKLLE